MDLKKHLTAVATDMYELVSNPAVALGDVSSVPSELRLSNAMPRGSFTMEQIVYSGKGPSAEPVGRIKYKVTIEATYEPFDE